MVDGRYMATNWIWCWLKYSYLKIFILRRNIQNDLNFGFDQQESKVNLQKETSSPESPSNVSPGLVQLVNLVSYKVDWNSLFSRVKIQQILRTS